MKKSFHKGRQNVAQQGRMVQKLALFFFGSGARMASHFCRDMGKCFCWFSSPSVTVLCQPRAAGLPTLGMQVVAPELMVMAIIYFMGTVSGAHLNPAVTLAFAVRRNFPWRRMPGYVLAQLLGGVAATLFLHAMLGNVGALGATLPGSDISNGTALALEVVLTARLVNTMLATASGARNIGTNGAIAVGGYIALAGLWAAPISGASMNPVRSFAPDMVRGDPSTTWIYIVGSVLGALIVIAFEWVLKNKPTVAGALAAQGTLDIEDSEKPEVWARGTSGAESIP
jgi:aquaporin Z